MQQFLDTGKKMLSYPILDKAIGREQMQGIGATAYAYGSYPGVELLRGQFILQAEDTFLPTGNDHGGAGSLIIIVAGVNWAEILLSPGSLIHN